MSNNPRLDKINKLTGLRLVDPVGLTPDENDMMWAKIIQADRDKTKYYKKLTEFHELWQKYEETNKIMKNERMGITEYQALAIETAIYGEGSAIVYPTLGLVGEAGEVANKVKKVIRDNNGEFTDEKKLEIAKELSDTCWYIAALARDLGYTMEEICAINLEKLASRKERGVISGSGDNR
jgi:NTP pyrophosphatase (non-canonical NTP hydrolase)